MAAAIRRIFRRAHRAARRAGNAAVGALTVALLKLVRLTNPDRMADIAGRVLRTIGPVLPEHRIARANLVAAFPEKPAAEINWILRGTWDNLGRVGVEFAHLDRLWDYDADHPERRSRIELMPADIERFIRLRDDGKPALVFTAHLANWELPAVCAATYGLNSAVLYRRPNISAIDAWVRKTRSRTMGTLIATGLDAPMKIAEALTRGTHIGMLVDQYYVRGVEVIFFGRRTNANPLIARLAQHFDCPIHGTRIVRLPDHRFRAELTEAIEPVRGPDGKVDIAGTMQVITGIIEGWIREHPEQWLWQHRRWR
jgi:KDO2-lipid IV(A) lauroyltransferase